MKGIIIGAGRGSRLMPYTEDQPKCFAEVGGRRILDWVIASFVSGGLSPSVFIGGYRIGDVRRTNPEFTFRHNSDWENNNILASLMYAEADMADGFVSSYSDIIFTPNAVSGVLESEGDIVLAVDTAWRKRYEKRTQHPEDDGEKVLADGARVVRVDRTIESEEATGEFIGVAKFSPRGAALLIEHFGRVSAEVGDGPFQGATNFKKAYLIHMIQELVELGVDVRMIPIDGGYFEIDTTEDYDIAKEEWPGIVENWGAW